MCVVPAPLALNEVNMKLALLLSLNLIFSNWALAQIEIVDGESTESETRPETGKKAAQEYFLKRKKSKKNTGSRAYKRQTQSYTPGPAERYMSLYLGMFFDEESYKWADGNSDDVSQINGGVTYRVGEWVNSMDMNFRADLTSYDLRQGKAVKLSLLPLITFPDVRSRFPLYFGAGAGLGIFFKQVNEESHIALDYQVVAGARLFELVENMGLMAEVGMKNHVLLLSDGQFNGAFFSLGAIFEF